MTYHHGDLRRALLTAATQILEKEGHAGLSLREVARRAGVSHNAPYRHFADRDALLAAIAADGFRALRRRMAAAAKRAGAGRLRAIGETYVAFALDRPRLFVLMFGSEIDKAGDPALKDAAAETFALLQDAVAERVGGADPAPALVGSWAIVHGLAHLLIDRQLGASLTRGRSRAATIRAALAILDAGLDRRAPRDA